MRSACLDIKGSKLKMSVKLRKESVVEPVANKSTRDRERERELVETKRKRDYAERHCKTTQKFGTRGREKI